MQDLFTRNQLERNISIMVNLNNEEFVLKDFQFFLQLEVSLNLLVEVIQIHFLLFGQEFF